MLDAIVLVASVQLLVGVVIRSRNEVSVAKVEVHVFEQPDCTSLGGHCWKMIRHLLTAVMRSDSATVSMRPAASRLCSLTIDSPWM